MQRYKLKTKYCVNGQVIETVCDFLVWSTIDFSQEYYILIHMYNCCSLLCLISSFKYSESDKTINY